MQADTNTIITTIFCSNSMVLPLSLNLQALSSIAPQQLQGRRVFLRVDFNVPLAKDGRIADATRILQHARTIDFLRAHGAMPILLSHFGQPKKYDASLSFKHIISQIQEILEKEVVLLNDIEDINAFNSQKLVDRDGLPKIGMLDNIRFFAGEVENAPAFAKRLAQMADLYVNDAFSVSHRAHASVIGLPQFLTSYQGFALAEELANLQHYLGYMHIEDEAIGDRAEQAPAVGRTAAVGELRGEVAAKWPALMERVAIVGGKKVETKLPLLKALAKKVGTIVIVGGIANSFLDYLGFSVGKSFTEPAVAASLADFFAEFKHFQANEDLKLRINKEDLCKALKISDTCTIMLPHDLRYCTASEWELLRNPQANTTAVTAKIAAAGEVPNDAVVLDIGPETAAKIGELLAISRSVIWNGPAGYFEDERFAQGTIEIARKIIEYTRKTAKDSSNVEANSDAAASGNATHSHGQAAVGTAIGLTSVVGGGDSLAVFNRLDYFGNLRPNPDLVWRNSQGNAQKHTVGMMGACEGDISIAQGISQHQEEGALGGVDGSKTKFASAFASKEAHIANYGGGGQAALSYACTGGGAFLEWLSAPSWKG